MLSRGAVVVFLVAFAALPEAEGRDRADPAHGRDLGLVLSGGGAKGAYEVGVWQAICEAGLDGRVGAMSGTSVGSLCAVLFSSVRDPVRCKEIWMDAMANAFEVNIGSILATVLANGPGLAKYANDDGLMSKEALRRVVDANLPAWPPRTPVQVYATTAEETTLKRSSFRMDTLSRTNMLERIIASCALPVLFSPQTIDGARHVDGGLADNRPVAPIVENDPENAIKTVVVVYLVHDPGRRVAQGDVGARRLVEIIPSQDISLWIKDLDFAAIDNRPDTARRLIELGRRDARKVLKEAGLLPAEAVFGR